MDTNYYDVVVCGGETTGLIAGALLARRGFRVLLIGHEADHAGFEVAGTPGARAPGLLPPLDDAPAARVFKELDCTALVRRRAPGAKAGFRVVLPGQQIDFSTDASAQEREVARAFGAAAADVSGAISRLAVLGRLVDPLLASAITLPPNGFWERREVGRFESLLPRPGTDVFAPLHADHPLRAIASAPAALTGGLIAHDVGPVAEARAFDLAREGVHLHEGGLGAIHDLLLGRLETFGGDRRENLRPTAIVVRRGRVSGIRVQPRDETIGCEWLVWAGRASDMHRALGGNAPRSSRRGPLALATTGYRHALTLWVDAKAVPETVPPLTIAIGDPSRPLLEDNAVLFTAGTPGTRGSSQLPIWVECVVPASVVEPGPSYLAALRPRLVHTLGRVFPALKRDHITVASPYDGLPPEGPGTAGAKPAAGAPPLPPPVFGVTSPRPLDVMGVHHATGVDNLYLAARENLPGLGLEGELVSAWGVARLVSGRHTNRVGPQRRMLIGGG
jgi:phytoene dehydrogenase-like protein